MSEFFNVPVENTIWVGELKIYVFIWRENVILNTKKMFFRKSYVSSSFHAFSENIQFSFSFLETFLKPFDLRIGNIEMYV